MPWWLARSRPLLVLGLLIAFTSPAWAEVFKGSTVREADLTVYDQAVGTCGRGTEVVGRFHRPLPYE
jgi:hypothetical protein